MCSLSPKLPGKKVLILGGAAATGAIAIQLPRQVLHLFSYEGESSKCYIYSHVRENHFRTSKVEGFWAWGFGFSSLGL